MFQVYGVLKYTSPLKSSKIIFELLDVPGFTPKIDICLLKISGPSLSVKLDFKRAVTMKRVDKLLAERAYLLILAWHERSRIQDSLLPTYIWLVPHKLVAIRERTK